MRRRQLKWLWKRLGRSPPWTLPREEMLMKLGARADQAPSRLAPGRYRDRQGQPDLQLRAQPREAAAECGGAKGAICCAPTSPRTIRRSCGRYYIQLVAVEEAFKNLKGDLAIRPIFHQDRARIEAHIFIAFLAYCLQITLTRRLHALAPGPDRPQRAREVRRRPDDRRPSADHRRARNRAHPLYPARTRTAAPDRPAEAPIAAAAATQNHRRSAAAKSHP